MEIVIYFHDGSSWSFDNLEIMPLPERVVGEMQLIFFNGLTVRFNDDEKVIAHRIRTHALADGKILERYYIVITNERKLFFFPDGTLVSMPEGGESCAWWRTFAKFPAGAKEEVIDHDRQEAINRAAANCGRNVR